MEKKSMNATFDALIAEACKLVVAKEAEELDDIYQNGRKEINMPIIENWGWHNENEVMKGYVLYALKMIQENQPELQLSDEQKSALFNGIRWATSDLTAQEAYDYYVKN